MLINLSNHPSSNWEEGQKAAASMYGTIVDIAFPNIPPDLSVEEVEKQALAYLLRCESLISVHELSAIHLAGEPIFCFLLAQMLLANKHECLTSTSQRVVSEENGEKTSRFEFVQFRNYKLLRDG